MRATATPSTPAFSFAAVARFAARIRRSVVSRRVLRNVSTLDDHMLRDIGLNRMDVYAALCEPALADGTLVLARRARESRRNHGALVRAAQIRSV